MEFFIKKNSTIPILKMVVSDEGRSDFNVNDEIANSTAVTISLWDVEKKKYKVANRECIVTSELDHNGKLNYYIEYQLRDVETKNTGKYEIEILLTTNDGIKKLPLSEKYYLFVLESFSGDKYGFEDHYLLDVSCCSSDLDFPSLTPTRTQTPTPSITPTNTPTQTNTPTNTSTQTPTQTNTPTNTSTQTQTPTNTQTQTPTNTTTNTPTPSITTPAQSGEIPNTPNPQGDILLVTDIQRIYNPGSILATYNFYFSRETDVSFTINFTDNLPTNTGSTITSSTFVNVSVGVTSATTVTSISGDLFSLNQTSFLTNFGINVTGSTIYTYYWSVNSFPPVFNLATPTPTPTPSITPTNTPTPTITDTPTQTPTNTSTPTITNTSTQTPTNTPTPTITDTPTQTPTNTSTQTPTNTPTPTITPTTNAGGTPSTLLNQLAGYLRGFMSEFRNPNFYNYRLDGDGFQILDGGLDMFDNGNITSPWVRSGVVYSGITSYSQATYPFAINYSSATSSTTIDTDFQYVSLGYTQYNATTGQSAQFLPLTVLGTRSTSGTPVGFQMGGNSGADGGGLLASGMIYSGDVISGMTVYAFFREQYAAVDPSHCNLYMLFGHPNWNSVFGNIFTYAQPVSAGGCGGYLYTSGASVNNILAIQTLLSKSAATLVTSAECQTVVQNFVARVILGAGITPPSPTPTPTNTVTPTVTPTNTVTPTVTSTITVTPTNTPTVSLTPSNTATNTPTPTNTRTSTQTPTNTPTNTQTPTNTTTNTPSVTPTSTPVVYSADSIYNLLSATGQTLYTAATINDFIKVSRTDYDNVMTGLSQTSIYGVQNDVFYTGSTLSQFSGGWSIIDGGQTGITSGNYIVGYAMRTGRQLQAYSTRLISGGTVNGAYTYLASGNNSFTSTVTLNDFVYFIRKAPTYPTVGTSTFVGLYTTNNPTYISSTSARLTYYGTPLGPSWLSGAFSQIAFQVMVNNNKTW